jgi:hypothetical protein
MTESATVQQQHHMMNYLPLSSTYFASVYRSDAHIRLLLSHLGLLALPITWIYLYRVFSMPSRLVAYDPDNK